jgi:hypothetical protein
MWNFNISCSLKLKKNKNWILKIVPKLW